MWRLLLAISLLTATTGFKAFADDLGDDSSASAPATGTPEPMIDSDMGGPSADIGEAVDDAMSSNPEFKNATPEPQVAASNDAPAAEEKPHKSSKHAKGREPSKAKSKSKSKAKSKSKSKASKSSKSKKSKAGGKSKDKSKDKKSKSKKKKKTSKSND